MKALLLSEYKKLNVVEMPTPDIADDEVLVRVRACGICGSDIHGYDGSTGRRIPPLVMGHEAAGVIERAALIEAVSIAVHAVSRHVPKPDEAVLVVGSGMIGVLVIQVLREKGCRNIIAIDVDDDKLALAARVGAGRTVNGKDIDVPAAIRELTGGQGADASFEVVGHGSTGA